MYPVTRIFRSFQGEGHFVGYPMTFVRLAGCSVRDCHIRAVCDEAPWKATRSCTADEIISQCVQLAPTGIVCVTGGEPSDHDLTALVDRLNSARFRVHVETSGIRALPGLPVEWLTVSPKTPGYAHRTGNTLKLVVPSSWGWREIDELDRETTFFHRYLQPLTDPTGATNISHVMNLLLDARNSDGRWALSTQAHKTWGIP